MKNIYTLPTDIYTMAEVGGETPASTKVKVCFGKWFETYGGRKPNTIHFSELGKPCLRQLWYNVNDPLSDIDGKTKLKFFYGDMLEELVLCTAAAAGHTVERQQERVEYDIGNGWRVTGRIDAFIDGVCVDVKSTTKFGEEKFKGGLQDDPFGYYHQLNGYASVLGASTAAFVTIQKELGHLGVYPIEVNKSAFEERAKVVSEVVSRESVAGMGTIPDVPQSATSKNKKLSTTCGYCAYKKRCFPGVRTFIYSNGPVFLTEVVDLPRVPEVVDPVTEEQP